MSTFQDAAAALAGLDRRERALRRRPARALYRIETERFGVLMISADGIRDARKIAKARFQVGPKSVWRETR